MFIVMEIQKNANGTIGTLVDSFESRNAAESKFHTILASAAISQVPTHSAIMVTDEGIPQKYEWYNHEPEPTPEPEPEVEGEGE